MPTYIYACANHHLQEETHSIFAEPSVLCAECKGEMLRRPQSTTVTFGSDGFYTTDKYD
jgi:predicted nucleic acid-binding Zn ribbon protein